VRVKTCVSRLMAKWRRRQESSLRLKSACRPWHFALILGFELPTFSDEIFLQWTFLPLFSFFKWTVKIVSARSSVLLLLLHEIFHCFYPNLPSRFHPVGWQFAATSTKYMTRVVFFRTAASCYSISLLLHSKKLMTEEERFKKLCVAFDIRCTPSDTRRFKKICA